MDGQRDKEPYTLESGKRRYIFHILDLIQKELRESGDRDWLIDAVLEQSVRISHVKGRSMRVASGLKKLGLSHGDILHVSVGDPNLSVEALRAQIQDTKAKIVICTRETAKKYLEANKGLAEPERVKHILLIDVSPWQDCPPGTSSFRKLYDDDGSTCPTEDSFPAYDPKEASLINWTSGTTGMPKGVVISQEHMYFYLRKSKLAEKTAALTTSIFFHGGGFQLPLDGGINNKFQIHFIKPDDFSAEVLYQTVDKYKIQFYMCGYADFNAIASGDSSGYDLSSLQVAMPAGAQVGGISASFNSDNLGALRQGVEVYIRDQVTGTKLGPGQEGEIMAKTPTTMLYFLNRVTETSELFDENGFVFMGDLGYFDENGTLFYRERIKELLKLKNYWVGPQTIEDVIENIPGVAESIVWQKLYPETMEYVLEVALTVEKESTNLTPENIRQEANSKLDDLKQITGRILIVKELPHNPQGKKLRKQARKMF